MTNFSADWENAYSAGRGGDRWPWSDLVSYVMRYARLSQAPFRVLELGPAYGANIPFFAGLGVEYYGIEGSESAVVGLKERFPDLAGSIRVGDFTSEIPFDLHFDLIADRASLTHNSSAAIASCIELVRSRLVPQGLFIGIDWFSTLHSDFAIGTQAEDENTRKEFETGQFKGIGRTHFADRAHLEELFEDFVITHLEHKIVTEEIPHNEHVFASWNFVAQSR